MVCVVDVWLPNDTPLSTTNNVTRRVEELVRDVTDRYGREHPAKDGKPRQILESLTTFLGGGGPRFWFSVAPEIQQLNYAQIIIQVVDKEDTSELVSQLQTTISSSIAGARIDVRQLQTNPVEMPVQIRISEQADVSAGHSQDFSTIRALASQVEDILRSVPASARVRDDWNDETTGVSLEIDPDRASMAGVSNLDVALASSAAMSGVPVTTLREGNKEIPVIAQLRMEEASPTLRHPELVRVFLDGDTKNPAEPSLADSEHHPDSADPPSGAFPHDLCLEFPGSGRAAVGRAEGRAAGAQDVCRESASRLRDADQWRTGQTGERLSRSADCVGNLGIPDHLALLVQFDHAVKPFLVFAAAPYGVVGALLALAVMGTPFGFMAFLGVVSLIGVIVSHIIVLFDFIEEEHEKGEPLGQALIDAGIERLRPVMITVAATVLALFPLALEGGPLWEPLCYAQIGGLSVATFVTLLLVPVLYSIAVLDLKIVKWGVPGEATTGIQ